MEIPKPEILKVVALHREKRREKVLIQESCCGDKKIITRAGLGQRAIKGDWRCSKCARDKDEDMTLSHRRKDYGVIAPDWPVPPMVLRGE